MKKFYLALDLKDDPQLIEEYENWHKKIWPEIADSIKSSGINEMEIYRVGNRLFMVMETENDFSFSKKAALDAANPKVKEWESSLWKFQQPLPWAGKGEKWMLMKKIFDLNEQD